MTKRRILLLSDEVDRALYDHFRKEMLEGVDIIVSCGDLPARYLTFLADMFNGPILYVPGNHDEGYVANPPAGCTCIDGKVVECDGVRFAGLGGSLRYKPGEYQYSQKEMEKRVKKLRRPLKKSRGLDVLVTHAPSLGHNDGKGAHEGFEAFNDLIDMYDPAYHFYGHVHLSYDAGAPRVDRVKNTTTVNAFNKYIIDIEVPDEKRTLTASRKGRKK